MKQEDVEKVLISYKDSMGSCSRVPTRAPKHSPWGRRFAFGFTAVAFVGLGVVSMWPHDGRAATIRRVEQAISNAKTMDVMFTVERPKGKWWLLNHMYYRDGMWRFEIDQSSPASPTIVSRNGLVLVDYRSLDHATLEPQRSDLFPETNGDTNALEFAKSLLNSGQVSTDRNLTIVEHTPVKGRQAYAINMVRPSDSYHAELVVDKETNLPIYGQATLTQTTGLGEETISYRQEYKFNEPIADSLFSLHLNKPVVKVVEERAALLDSWRKPVAKIPGSEIRDVCVTPNGTVWVVSTSAKSTVLPDKLTDEEGDVYIRGDDQEVHNLEEEGVAQIDGHDLTLVPFINMNPNARVPRKLRLTFAQRMVAWYDYLPDKPVAGVVTLTPRIEPEIRPSWLTVLSSDRLGFQLELLAWNFRGKKYEADKRYLDAARAYEQSAKAYANFVKRGAYFPVKSAARCYALAGLAYDSLRCEQTAEELREKKER